MTALALSLALALQGPVSLSFAAPVDDEAPADLSEAERLFDEGIARYEAADYEGAIETFTLALSEVRGQGVDDFRIRGLLLYNIGRAHTRAYEIDRDVEHLRQAEAIFSRFLEQAEAHGDEVAREELDDAQAQLADIRSKLDELETEPPPPGPTPEPPVGEVDGTQADGARGQQAGRARGLGAGLTAGGVVLLGGGVGMLVWGLGYGPAAQAQVDELDALGLAADHPAYVRGEQFLADERRKGTSWIAAGSVGAALGVGLLAGGIAQLVKARRMREPGKHVAATTAIGTDGVFVGLRGRF